MSEALSVAYRRLHFWEKLNEKLLNDVLTAVFGVHGGDGGGHGGGDLLCAQRLAAIIPLVWVRHCPLPIAAFFF
jgi:hypothetical protein